MASLKTTLHLAVFACLVASCGVISERRATEWSAVATVGGRDATAQNLVRSVLEKHKIPCFMEGSMGYAVMVPKDRLLEARDALLESPQLEGESSFRIIPQHN